MYIKIPNPNIYTKIITKQRIVWNYAMYTVGHKDRIYLDPTLKRIAFSLAHLSL